jgi:hypothetical protein
MALLTNGRLDGTADQDALSSVVHAYRVPLAPASLAARLGAAPSCEFGAAKAAPEIHGSLPAGAIFSECPLCASWADSQGIFGLLCSMPPHGVRPLASTPAREPEAESKADESTSYPDDRESKAACWKEVKEALDTADRQANQSEEIAAVFVMLAVAVMFLLLIHQTLIWG